MANDLFGQTMSNVQTQRSEYARQGAQTDLETNRSVTIIHEVCNFKLDTEFIGSPNPTIFIIGHPLASNVGSMLLGGYTSISYYNENFTTTTFLDSANTTAQWSTTGSLIY